MALILSIDTATENAIVSLGKEEEIIAFKKNEEQKNHASFVQPAILQILKENNIEFKQIDAIAVSAGPGSYTGLRVGLASAKGLCFALGTPLILLNTLQVMSAQVVQELHNSSAYYCPMIDARRMEVFTAIYDYSLKEILLPNPENISDNNFIEMLSSYKNEIVFFGSGMPKWKATTHQKNFIFYHSALDSPNGINRLAQQHFMQKDFADLTYSEPYYFKDFYTTAKING
ncbi:MAG: tRNA (adenosine(37)-N6)-threonylcarbamoyltransferase complex dimerization subunit type 1 TsaB [Arachidicoccus sp.]|nr:tRNA (adenosine(37)-N6)-threonylcarbamoyltransferase complex dimerization subunit type 1 TsaB [Arachidicoccus sp.]